MGHSTSQGNPWEVTLRKAEQSDLEHFFRFQSDKEANYLAAFTAKDPTDKAAYFEKYSKLLANPEINTQTILVNDTIAGSIARFELMGDQEITYWIDKNYWGKGIGTTALKLFLTIEKARPIVARVAFDNYGSQKILENAGFVRTGQDKGFANARQTEIEEFIYEFHGI